MTLKGEFYKMKHFPKILFFIKKNLPSVAKAANKGNVKVTKVIIRHTKELIEKIGEQQDFVKLSKNMIGIFIHKFNFL